jgi:hypothetical protein
MKTLTSILLMFVRVFCMVKILIWLFQQNYSANHPISEIQQYLVYLLLDIWIVISAKQFNEEN